MTNRVETHAATLRECIAKGKRIDGGELSAEGIANLNANMAVSFAEHFTYQNLQASAHARGTLTPDEATTVYRALGEVGSEANGGWAKGTDLALKVTVTSLMAQLVTEGR